MCVDVRPIRKENAAFSNKNRYVWMGSYSCTVQKYVSSELQNTANLYVYHCCQSSRRTFEKTMRFRVVAITMTDSSKNISSEKRNKQFQKDLRHSVSNLFHSTLYSPSHPSPAINVEGIPMDLNKRVTTLKKRGGGLKWFVPFTLRLRGYD